MALIEAEEAAPSSVHVEPEPARRRRRWPWVVGLGIVVLAFFALRGIGTVTAFKTATVRGGFRRSPQTIPVVLRWSVC